MPKPDKIWLYRITHVDNLPHILRHGLVVAGHPQADPGFRSIGDSSLIGVREDLDAPNPPGGKFSEYVPFYILRSLVSLYSLLGKFSEYVPFYLGHRSPMLFQIATGFTEISQQKVESLLREAGLAIQVKISKKAYYDNV